MYLKSAENEDLFTLFCKCVLLSQKLLINNKEIGVTGSFVRGAYLPSLYFEWINIINEIKKCLSHWWNNEKIWNTL